MLPFGFYFVHDDDADDSDNNDDDDSDALPCKISAFTSVLSLIQKPKSSYCTFGSQNRHMSCTASRYLISDLTVLSHDFEIIDDLNITPIKYRSDVSLSNYYRTQYSNSTYY